VQVLEVNQPDKATRRRRGKTDAVDAEAAARAVLSGRDRKAVLVAADPALRESLSGLSTPKLIRRCAQLDTGRWLVASAQPRRVCSSYERLDQPNLAAAQAARTAG